MGKKKRIYGDAKQQGYMLTDVRKQLTSNRGRMKDVLL
jgi:hypothetical protein